MSRLVRITASPRDPATGVVMIQRMAGGGQYTPYYFDNEHWAAGVADIPRFSDRMGFDQTGWTGGSRPTTGTIGFAPSTPAKLAQLTSLYWPDASLLVEVAEEAPAPVWQLLLTGTVAAAQQRGGSLVFTATDLGGPFDQPVLNARFGGTGGIEGGAEAAGRLKRRTWGRAFNVEGRIFDKAYNIFEFSDPAFPWKSIDALRDIGRAGPRAILPWQGSAAATLAALRGTKPPQGGGVVAPSIAMASWWTQPNGPLTADVQGEIGPGYVETIPEIAARVVSAGGAGTITNAAAAAVIRAGAAGYHIDSDSETVANALDRLLLPVAMTWSIEPAGGVRIQPITLTAPVETVRSINVARQAVYPPMSERRVGFQRAWRVHREGELASVLQAGDVAFSDGTLLKDVQPAEPGATNGAGLDPTAPAGVLRDFAGKPFYPEELRNADLSLSPSGRLTALIQGPGGNLIAKDLGQVSAGSIGASTESAERRFAEGLERLSEVVARIAADTSLLRKTVRDAGIIVDPASGRVSIYANEQLAKVAISLDAQTQSISFLATRAEVDRKILEAVLNPEQVAQLASIIAQIDQLEIDINAAEGAIALKADTAALNTLGLRVTGAEQVIQSLPDKASVRQDVTASRYGFNQHSAEAVLRAMLAGDKSLRLTQQSLAAARQEIGASVIENTVADARFRLDLSAQIGAVSGLVAQEAIARVDGDKAVAGTVTSLKTTVDNQAVTLTTYGQSIDGLSAKWGVEIDAGGRATGFALNSTGQRTDFVLRVDRFYLSRPGAPANEQPFAVFDISGGVFYLNARLKAQSIDTPMFNGRVVTRREAVTLGSAITGAGGGLGDVLTFMVDLPYAADVIIQFIGSQTYSGSPVPDWGADILVNGVTQAVQGGGAGIYSSGFALACKVSLPANAAGQPQTVKARWSGGNGNITLKNATLIVDGAFA